MASLAEIRAKLKEQESKAGGNRGPQGPNPIYPFWNIKEGESATMRFLPDGDRRQHFLLERTFDDQAAICGHQR